MTKHQLHTDDAPAAVGPYSQGISAGRLVFTSGQLPMKNGVLITDDVAEAARASLENVSAILKNGTCYPVRCCQGDDLSQGHERLLCDERCVWGILPEALSGTLLLRGGAAAIGRHSGDRSRCLRPVIDEQQTWKHSEPRFL